jgi:pimeloyl-ACP methyl ester carboxylesterase
MAAGSDLRFLRVGDIELAYTTMGERDRPPVLLVAGLGAQLISWEDGFCDQLVDRRPVPVRRCWTAPERTEALRRVEVPTLVVHGAADPLMGVSGGLATAATIPGAELLAIDGMGHDLPEPVWSEVVDRITGHITRAEGGETRGSDGQPVPGSASVYPAVIRSNNRGS